MNRYFRHQKKSIIRDAKTGVEYTLRTPRYGRKNQKQCLGGCMLSGFPRRHDSGEETAYCNKLRILQKAGEIKSYEGQKTFHLRDRHEKACGSMRVDFVVTRNDGSVYIAEYKGRLFETLAEFRLKRALFSYCYPEWEYQTVTEKDLL